MSYYQQLADIIKKQPTNIWGLKFFPSIEPEVSNDLDYQPFGADSEVEVSDCNIAVVEQIVDEMTRSGLNAIMEIGVARNGARSMSMVLTKDKPKDCFYLGVDLEDKSYLNDVDRNSWTMICNSHDQVSIRNFLAEKGIQQLDILFIDGWHSVNTTVNDWLYAELVRPGGVVILHDSNAHPGCVALFEAVDETLFSKRRSCLVKDNGIAVFRRL